MKIEILGTGCPKCQKLYEHAQTAITKAGSDAEVVKVTKLADITAYGVMITPALAIDGQVKITGKIPSVDDIVNWIS
ncbi:MAG: TM0996/MTH895 family glutaredoxin-like protein [Candidatus Omnitrophica bacterium]|nr:TM0996/MTH895 family glutaredoxin-like protein [Candidatus Omnitrophota bacterium]